MCELIVKKLNDGLVSVPFTLIKQSIERNLNLTIYYKDEKMQISWEKLASKFAIYDKSPMGFEEWDFKFNPNEEEKQNDNKYAI